MAGNSKGSKLAQLRAVFFGCVSDCTIQEMRWRLGARRIGLTCAVRAAFVALLVLLVSYWTLATCCGHNPTQTALARHKRGWLVKARLPAIYSSRKPSPARREAENLSSTSCHSEGKNRRPREQTWPQRCRAREKPCRRPNKTAARRPSRSARSRPA